MGLLPFLSIIHTITIGTILNFNGGNNGHGLKNVACKQTFTQIQGIQGVTFCSQIIRDENSGIIEICSNQLYT